MLQSPGFDFSQTYIDHGYIELCIPPINDEVLESVMQLMLLNLLRSIFQEPRKLKKMTKNFVLNFSSKWK